jgi:hypothetical protein
MDNAVASPIQAPLDLTSMHSLLPRVRGIGILIVLGAFLVRETRSAQVESGVKEEFANLQAALKAKDAPKIWDLLDSATQADATRTAKIVKAAFKKASAKGKAKQQETLGLAADELGKLDGQSLLKTKPFLAKYDEIPTSKITFVTVQEDSAVLNYLEADGDKEKLNYSRQGGKWKVALPMPQFPK